LGDQLVHEEVHEGSKLHQVNAVPEIFDVLEESILTELDQLEEEQESLSHKARNVA